MLARPAETANQFTRRDAGRLILASVLLVAAMSVILGVDFLPAQTQLELGKPAPANVTAPITTEYTSDVLTARARQAARDAVEPQYDFTVARGAAVAAQQVRELDREVATVDAAFADGVTPEDRAAILGDVLPGVLGADERATLLTLDATAGRPCATRRPGSSTPSSGPSCAIPRSSRCATASRAGSRAT